VWTVYSIIATSVSPIGAASGDIITYILGFGPLGVGIVLFALGYLVPKPVKDSAVAAARSDVIAENERLRTALARAEEQRDDALRVARDTVVPLLTTFNATVASLLPILQDVVREQEDRGHRRQIR
jgi:hypothetical protein